MKTYYLKNKIDGEIIDVIAKSLIAAKWKASKMLGGYIWNYNTYEVRK